ncbi:MAG: uracil-DNA glycosylase [Pseudomonadota bacterium]
MPQYASAAALKALTEWWEEMGIEVDQAEIDAALKSQGDPPIPAQAAISSDETRLNEGNSRPREHDRKSSRQRQSKSLHDWLQEAHTLAEGADSLESLKTAIESFDGCPLKQLCEKTVVYDGTLGAPVMILGEGPGGQEDQQGLPFVGKAGQLLDKMLGAIGLDRKTNTFISNVNYWRPPGNRNPEPDELALCRPFVDRMVDLAQPKIIIATGGVAAKSLLNTKTGIMRLRGTERPFDTPAGTRVPMVPMFHPAYLLRRPQDKSRAWRDLLLVQARLKEMGVEV